MFWCESEKGIRWGLGKREESGLAWVLVGLLKERRDCLWGAKVAGQDLSLVSSSWLLLVNS